MGAPGATLNNQKRWLPARAWLVVTIVGLPVVLIGLSSINQLLFGTNILI
jgi:hypothetical protein